MSQTALAQIRARGHIGIRLGLERMARLLAELGDPQESLRGVLIGGTNGKGSTQAMVASMLCAGGYSTLQSPSPHLSSYRERIIIDGEPISAADLEELLGRVLAASLAGEPRHGAATQFELLTAAAFLWGAQRGVQVAVVEVGLGGRLDATNTWDGGVAAITNVGMDHQEYLGDTIEEIAAEKAAIIKTGDRAISAASGEALAVISEHCARSGVPLDVTPALQILHMDTNGLHVLHDDLGQLDIALLGRIQAQNAAVALGVMGALSDSGIATVSGASQRSGLADVRWPGRMELLDAGGQAVLLDGAHNRDGAAELAATLDELRSSLPRGRATLLIGIMRDKEIELVLETLARSSMLGCASVVASGVPDTDRGLAADELAARWKRISGTDPVPLAIEDADAALGQALDRAREEGGLLVVAGSLYLIGHIRSRLRPAEQVD